MRGHRNYGDSTLVDVRLPLNQRKVDVWIIIIYNWSISTVGCNALNILASNIDESISF